MLSEEESCGLSELCMWRTILLYLQRKSVEELHPTLALPLIASASLAFLKRHLALPASQQALIDESLEANSRRLIAAERALAEAEIKVGSPDIAC